MLFKNCYTLSFIGVYNLINYAFTTSYPLEIASAPDGRLLLTGATKFSQDLTKRQNPGTRNTRPRPAGASAVTPKAATAGGNTKSLKQVARTLNKQADEVTKGLRNLKRLNAQKIPTEVGTILKIVADEAAPRDEIGKALSGDSAVQRNVAAIKQAGPNLRQAIEALKTGTPGATFSKQVDNVLKIREPTLAAVKSIIKAAETASK